MAGVCLAGRMLIQVMREMLRPRASHSDAVLFNGEAICALLFSYLWAFVGSIIVCRRPYLGAALRRVYTDMVVIVNLCLFLLAMISELNEDWPAGLFDAMPIFYCDINVV